MSNLGSRRGTAVAVGAAAALLAAATGLAVAQWATPPASRATGPAAAGQVSGPAIPKLTDAERAAAVAVATGSPVVKEILGGQRFAVASVGVWHTRSLEKIGASVVLSPSQPLSVPVREWPAADWRAGPAGSLPYTPTQVTFGAENVTQLVIMVDLNQGQVAQVSAAPGARLILPPGTNTRNRGNH